MVVVQEKRSEKVGIVVNRRKSGKGRGEEGK